MEPTDRTPIQPWRVAAAVGWGLVALVLLGVWFFRDRWSELLFPDSPIRAETAIGRPPEVDDSVRYRVVGWDALPGWRTDPVEEAHPALARSCRAITERPAEGPAGRARIAGTVGDWSPFCEAVVGAGPEGTRAAVRRYLVPLEVSTGGETTGLLTGYYEPILRGSRRREGPYRVPLYVRPPELVSVDLGLFREDLEGRRIAGRLDGGRLVPYHDRAAIEAGALAGRGLELLWLDDPVDVFFLHIQGSGRIRLPSGETVRVGYAAQNGHPYAAIGRELVDREAMTLEDVSMGSIRRWLTEHPEEAADVMAVNASYVFFDRREGLDEDEGPVGSLGVPLTPERSIAVDPGAIPLGAPVWVAGRAPAPDSEAEDRVLERLVVAQDTGGAIRGAVRADVFWGTGDRAGEIAGRMRHEGRLWVLVPEAVAREAERGTIGAVEAAR